MTDLSTPTLDRQTPAKIARKLGTPREHNSAQPATTISATKLAEYLDLSRTRINQLEAEGVFQRLAAGGFNINAARIAYIRHLRRNRQQSPSSEAAASFQRAKTRMLELKIAKQEGDLMMTDEAMDMVARMVGMFRTGLHSLPARTAGRDLQMRRRIESFCDDILKNIADEANRQAEKLERELGITINDDDTITINDDAA